MTAAPATAPATPVDARRCCVDHAGVSVEHECEPLAYAVVANIARETAHGEGGLQIQKGLKHFAPGAKVWVLPSGWGDGGERLIVVGRHRGSAGRYIRMVVRRRHLTNFRVRGVYSPALLQAMERPGKPWAPMWDSREHAQGAAEFWQQSPLWARLDDDQGEFVSDPPPMQLQRNGTIYYLAHFNAHRALYSSQPPPKEAPLPFDLT